MKLTAEELAKFAAEGYLFFPDKFSTAEAEVLKNAASDVYAMDRKEVWRESSGVARTAFAKGTARHPIGGMSLSQTCAGRRRSVTPPDTCTAPKSNCRLGRSTNIRSNPATTSDRKS